MTENELLKRRPTPESIGMGSYGMDSHNVQRYVTPEGHVQNEGDIGVSTNGPYQIALGSIQPRREQCTNLLVPVCVSSSHIAFGSIRMEPVFMILGQSAATVAVMAIDQNSAVQDVPYDQLRARLLEDGQVLESAAPQPRGGSSCRATSRNRGRRRTSNVDGRLVDQPLGRLLGRSRLSARRRRARDGKATARFETRLPPPGGTKCGSPMPRTEIEPAMCR